jgi:hypothetical protein
MLSTVLNLVSVSNFLLDNRKLDFKFSYACCLLCFFQFYRIIDNLIFLFALLESITVIVCNLAFVGLFLLFLHLFFVCVCV